MQKTLRKILSYTKTFFIAASAGALGTFFSFLIYRTPLRVRWARFLGHRFHKSSIFWFKEGEGIHTRAVFLLPRLQTVFPKLKTLDIGLEFYDESGKSVAQKTFANVDAGRFFTLQSDRLPEGFRIPAPFSGSLVVKQTLHVPDEEVFKAQKGIFASTHIYLDYYSEDRFVSTLHDYSAYLPDQGINVTTLGMIPAYCDKNRETFLLFYSVKPGIGPRDVRVFLYNDRGEKKEARLPALKSFSMKRIFLSELFPDAEAFLGGRIGQVMIHGFFRQLLRRTAFGVLDRKSGTFSIDHCFYSGFDTPAPMLSAQRAKMPKGSFSPFLVYEDERTTTAAIIYQSAGEPEKTFDVLIYDATGRLLVQLPKALHLAGNRVERLAIREILERNGVPTPFTGKAELVFHDDGQGLHEIFLEHHVEYSTDGKMAHVLHGADFWNPSKPVKNENYQSGNRIICNRAQTTWLAISNCSHDYDYDLEVHFRLNLMAGDGQIVASAPFTIGPDATIFKPIEWFFSDAEKLLESSNSVGVAVTTEINCLWLTHAFLTQDRQSKVFAVEHSISMIAD